MRQSSSHPEPDATPFPRRGHLLLAAVVLTFLAAYGSFVPLEFKRLTFDQAVDAFRHIEYLELGLYRRADLVANLLLFIPLGFCWLGVVDVDRRSRIPALLAAPFIAAGLAGLAIAIEFGQLWTTRRTVSQNDIYAEVAGGVIGIALWFVVGRPSIRFVRGFFVADHQAPPVKRLLQLYAVAFVLYALQPFDFAFSAEALREKMNPGRDDLVSRILLTPFSHEYKGLADLLWQCGTDALLFIPIGMMLRLSPRSRTGLRSVPAAAGLALLFAAALETAQLFVFTRFADTTDIITGSAGGLLGAIIAGPLFADAARPSPRKRHRRTMRPAARLAIALVLIAVYAVCLAAAFWSPYDLVPDRQTFQRQLGHLFAAPFRAYYYGSEFAAMSNLLRGFMLFAPIGAALRWAFGPRTRAGIIASAVAAIAVGLMIEAGQAAFVNKFADITDITIYLTGTLAGWATANLILRDHDRPDGRPPADR